MLFQRTSRVKKGRFSQIVKITAKRMPNNVDTQTTISKHEIMRQHYRSCGIIGEKLERISMSSITVGTKTRKPSIKRRMGMSARIGMLIYASEKCFSFRLRG